MKPVRLSASVFLFLPENGFPLNQLYGVYSQFLNVKQDKEKNRSDLADPAGTPFGVLRVEAKTTRNKLLLLLNQYFVC